VALSPSEKYVIPSSLTTGSVVPEGLGGVAFAMVGHVMPIAKIRLASFFIQDKIFI
jgi:hypothetical protein